MRSLFALLTASASMLVTVPAAAEDAPPAPAPAPPAPAAAAPPAPAAAAPPALASSAPAPLTPALEPYRYPYPNGAPYLPYGYPGAPYYGNWSRVPPPARTERRSPGMMITGITLFGLGGAANVFGAGLLVRAVTTPCATVENFREVPQAHRSRFRSPPAQGERIGTAQQALGCGASPTAPVALLVGGVLGSLAGVPLFLIGNQQVRVQPELNVGAGSADLRLRF